MAKIYLRSIVLFCLLWASNILSAQQPAISQQSSDYAIQSDYTDCSKSPRFSLPLDIYVEESVWLKGYIKDLTQGVSAYLYGDSDLQFEIYASCFLLRPVYTTTFKHNKTSTINHDAIQNKLEENGLTDYASPIYIRISPIDSKGSGRLVMRPDTEKMYSDCSAPLNLYPGVNLYSYRTYDVYVLDPRDLPAGQETFVQWYSKDTVPCQSRVTLNSCDGEVLYEKSMLTSKDVYRFSGEELTRAAQNNQVYYIHFSHDVDSTGRVRCLEPVIKEVTYQRTACQGKGYTVGDTTLHESTLYFRDTAYISSNIYYIRYYDVTITEPDIQYDTLALKSTQLPYVYRKSDTITAFGDYDITIHKPKKCDERYLLHVSHKIDTLIRVRDTLLCYGGIFEYKGAKYSNNVSFAETSFRDADTYVIDSLYVSFAPRPEVLCDTIVQGERKYNRLFDKSGDYAFLYANPTTFCTDSILLHVKPAVSDVQYDYFFEEYTLCQGKNFIHEYFDSVYTSSVVLVDSMQVSSKRWEITTVTVTFIEPEITYDTLALKLAQLPYNYHNKYTITSLGDHDFVTHQDDTCDEHFVLHVVHTIDSLTATVDTVLCQGKTFQHGGVEYTSATSFTEATTPDADTYLLTTYNVAFTAPEMQYDTLSLKSVQLPYDYHGLYTISTFGRHEFLSQIEGACDERYTLYVEHDIDTLYTMLDTVLCQGKIYSYDGVVYTQNTTFNDTVKLNEDTYEVLTISVSFLAPETVTDTLSLKTTDMPYTYRGQYNVSQFGNYDVLIAGNDACDEHYLLYVEHDIDTLYTMLDTVLCRGKIYSYDGVAYTQNATFNDTVKLNEDTYEVLTISVSFLAPEMVTDTLSLKTTDLPYTYRGQYAVSDFGHHDVLITHHDACDERYILYVEHNIDTLYATVDTTLCQGKIYSYDGVVYTQNTTFNDTVKLNEDTYEVLTISVSFLAPETVTDTLSLKTTDMPYTYRGQYAVSDFGHHDVLITHHDACDEHYLLYVEHDIDTTILLVDTFMCYGSTFEYKEQHYLSDTTFVLESWINDDLMQIDSVSVTFAAVPDQVFDTLSITLSELPYTYREQVIEAFGDYEFMLKNDEGCVEQVMLHVERHIVAQSSYRDLWCNLWHILLPEGTTSDGSTQTWQYTLSHDTIIADHSYSAAYRRWTAAEDTTWEYVAAVRFTDDRKAYVYYDNTEYLLYDFNLEKGQRVKVFAGVNHYHSHKTSICIVDEVTYTPGQDFSSEIHLSVFPNMFDNDQLTTCYGTTVWIEGVGDACGFLTGADCSVNGHETYLLCAYKDDQLQYLTDREDLSDYGCEYNRTPTSVESIPADDASSSKRIIDGNLYILHNDQLYNLLGQPASLLVQ